MTKKKTKMFIMIATPEDDMGDDFVEEHETFDGALASAKELLESDYESARIYEAVSAWAIELKVDVKKVG